MPLFQSKSKKAFKHNIEAEMHAGKPKDQSLAIAYAVQRKPKKKMAEGGAISASNEKRPMPDEAHNDSKSEMHNDGKKALKQSGWTDQPTVIQARKDKMTKLSQPKMAAITGPFSVRLRDMKDEEAKMESSMPPESEAKQPSKKLDEMSTKQTSGDPDEQKQHNNKRKAYYDGGVVDHEYGGAAEEDEDPSISPLDGLTDEEAPKDYMSSRFAEGGSVHDEDEIEHAASIAAAIMSKMDDKKMMAEGGQVDLDLNSMEQPNGYYERNEDAALKENYDSDFDSLHEPLDSEGDSRESDEENEHDGSVVSKIMNKMKKRSAIIK